MDNKNSTDIDSIKQAAEIKNTILKLIENRKMKDIVQNVEIIAKLHRSKPSSDVRKELVTVYSKLIIFYMEKKDTEKTVFYIKKLEGIQSRYSNEKYELYMFEQLICAFEIAEKRNDKENGVTILKSMMKLVKKAPYSEIIDLYTELSERVFGFVGLTSRYYSAWGRVHNLCVENINNAKSINNSFFPTKMLIDILIKKYGAIISRNDGGTVDLIFLLKSSSSVSTNILRPTVTTHNIPGFGEIPLKGYITREGIEFYPEKLGVDFDRFIEHFDEYDIVFKGNEVQ